LYLHGVTECDLVETANNFLNRSVKTPYLLPRERETILRTLEISDKVSFVVRQKRSSGAPLSPSVVLTTGKRVIIINRWAGGLKSDISFIPYRNILSVRIAHGILFSSIYIRLKASAKGTGTVFAGERQEGEVHGLNKLDADYIFKYIGKIIHNPESVTTPQNNYYYVQGSVSNHLHIHNPSYTSKQSAPEPEQRKPDITPTYVVGRETLQLQSSLNQQPEIPREKIPEPLPIYSGMSVNGMEGKVIQPSDLFVHPGKKSLQPDDLLIFKMRKKNSAGNAIPAGNDRLV
jgi:hypothetical protein